MSTMEAGAASDVLADLDELDSVMGVETQDQQDLKPKQVRVCLLTYYCRRLQFFSVLQQ